MKKLLTLIAVIACLNVSAQTMVYDTTVVRTPLVAAPKGVTGYDSLYMPAATTTVNGYMTAQSVNDIGNLQTGLVATNSNVTNLQTTTAALAAYPTPNTQTAAYTVTAGDRNKMIIMTNAAAVTITLPLGLTAGWTCSVVSNSSSTTAANQTITFAAATGVTIKSASSYKRSSVLYGVTVITYLGSNIFSLSGNLKL